MVVCRFGVLRLRSLAVLPFALLLPGRAFEAQRLEAHGVGLPRRLGFPLCFAVLEVLGFPVSVYLPLDLPVLQLLGPPLRLDVSKDLPIFEILGLLLLLNLPLSLPVPGVLCVYLQGLCWPSSTGPPASPESTVSFSDL
jgi:hypothetical protein